MKRILPGKLSLLNCAPLIDSHIHLDSEAYAEDWKEVWERARAHSLRALVLPSTNLASTQRIARMSREDPLLFPTAGFHPHQAAEFNPETSPGGLAPFIEAACAIGETGLEAHYDFCPWERQLDSLRYHLKLAKERNLPLILHCREAETALYQELKSLSPFQAGGVVHCYTGPWDMAQRFLELGFHLGINGIVTLANANQVHDVARKAPLDRLLLETDGPYLAPKPFRGYRNEPALVPLVAASLASLREDTVENIAIATSRNSKQLFRLPLEV